MKEINNRINRLRAEMQKLGVNACVITDNNPHLNEYSAPAERERTWISGFDGSNGIVVITAEKAALWTDSRYTLQAQEQLKNTEFQIFTTRNLFAEAIKWLKNEILAKNPKIALRLDVFPAETIEKAEKDFAFVHKDLISTIWENRPVAVPQKIFLFDEKYSGKPTTEKLSEIRAEMAKENADALILTDMEEVAWTFNFRACDLPHSPVAAAFAVVEQNRCTLFIDSAKLTYEVKQAFENQNIVIFDYSYIAAYLTILNKSVWLDKSKINSRLFGNISKNCKIIDKISPAAVLKSKKNAVEIAGVKNACIKDGIALARLLMWIEENTENISELAVSDKLHELKSAQPLFFGESFATIAGYAEHGAIAHYIPNEQTDKALHAENFLLLDAGTQFFDGTTDMTRTLALGEPTAQQKTDYTLVLKGHIALAQAKFPSGTFGYQLDTLARQFLWQNGITYGHGTGHGIGHFLNVHEYPPAIRYIDEKPTALAAGMLISNEPSISRAGEYGVRLENMVLVVESEETAFGKFLQFETISLIPFDSRAIDFSLLTENEKRWLDNYHQTVFEKISPHLTEKERKWLKEKTRS
ncbi:Xaa-Pro aminopeptidase [Bacteroidia bacterium]|nr:Xaa-Pro aminopeptidase [Bacteroidia bacterium]